MPLDQTNLNPDYRLPEIDYTWIDGESVILYRANIQAVTDSVIENTETEYVRPDCISRQAGDTPTLMDCVRRWSHSPTDATICRDCGSSYCGINPGTAINPPAYRCVICESDRYCIKHCGCKLCHSCDEYVTKRDICENCDRCTDCCNDYDYCRYCEGCDSRRSSDYFNCSDCENCDNCCNCNYIYVDDNPLKFWYDDIQPRINQKNKKRFLAVEIEVNAWDKDYAKAYKQLADKWSASIVKDGSIDRADGFEINTAPAQRDKFHQQISEWCQVLSASDAEANNSCGLHVHVGAEDFDWLDIKKLVKLYSRIELALFALVPVRRRRSTYSLPCGERYTDGLASAGDNKYKLQAELIANTYYDTSSYVPNGSKRWNKKSIINDYKYEKKERRSSARYVSLNLHSWIYRKTIECRLFNGTTNQSNIENWAYLWEAILNTAYYLSEKEIDYLISSVLNTTRSRIRILTSDFNMADYGEGDCQVTRRAVQSQLDLLRLIAPSETTKAWINKRLNLFTPICLEDK